MVTWQMRPPLRGVYATPRKLQGRGFLTFLPPPRQRRVIGVRKTVLLLASMLWAALLVRRGKLSAVDPQREAGNGASESLAWWSGLSAISGGVLYGAWGYLHGLTPYISATVGVLPFGAPLLFLLGIVGLRHRCELVGSRLAGTGFGLAYLGTVIGGVKGAGLSVPENWEQMVLAGLTLVSVVALRSKGLRRWGVLTLTMVAAGWVYAFTNAYQDGVGRWAHVASGVLFCLSWVVLGIALLRSARA
jgi:hypothetical protein